MFFLYKTKKQDQFWFQNKEENKNKIK
jgi:hypothetical protein